MLRNITRTAVMIFSVVLVCGLPGCGKKEGISFSYSDGGYILFENSGIQLRFDDKMYAKVFYHDTTRSLNEAAPGTPFSKPSHFIVLDGEEITEFLIDYGNIEVTDIKSEFGTGKRLVLKGTATGPQNSDIEKILNVELYEEYPDVAITYATYGNLGTADLTIGEVYNSYYRLDASLTGATEVPYEFWSYQGSALEWGEDYIFQLADGFSQDNYMGVQPTTRTGGGVPVVDLWTQQMGMAIAHIEPKPILVSLPVEVQADKKVSIAVRNNVGKVLPAREIYHTINTMVSVHSLDYFDALKNYTKLIEAQGLKMKQPSAEAYEAIWCGWGYKADFTPDDILGTLPKLKELDIHWVVIDDRWFDRYGDWNVREDIFPRGDDEFRELVDTLHKAGFKAKIWWMPPAAQPGDDLGEWPSATPGMADVTKNHPEWLIMDEDGTFPKDDRKMYYLCPTVTEVQDYIRELTIRFIRDWDFDGHKLDAYFTVPPCFNPAHHHSDPAESHEELPILFKIIYEVTKSIKPNSVIEICNCGVAQDYFQAQYIDQPVTADPVGSKQVRRRIKAFKALMGPQTAAYADHVELTAMDRETWREFGRDFASGVGTGGVIGTKFTWPRGGVDDVVLTPEKELHWQKWFDIYNEKMLSKGDYLNLYDIAYDKPETHVVRKGANIYYGFYAESWSGDIELRGLDDTYYRVYDYVNQVDLGQVKGPHATLSPTFADHLLIECVPAKDK